MSLILNGLALLALFIASFVGVLYVYFKRKYGYWAKKKISHTTPTFPLGDIKLGKHVNEWIHDVYLKFPDKPFVGFWLAHKPHLMIRDPDLIRAVLVQDFHVFPDHGTYSNEKDDPLSAHLFSMNGQRWKNLRAKLSPTFTSGKMKGMFPIFETISQKMLNILEPTADAGGVVEIKDLTARYSTDIIASVAYGIETSSLDNPDSIFRTMGKRIFMPTWENMTRNMLAFFLPDIARLFNIVQTDKKLSNFFRSVVTETIDYREKNNVERNDVMQLLIQLKNKGFIDDVDRNNADGTSGDPFTLDLAAANAFVFFIGGYETSSSVLQFVMYELAKNPSIQDRLREEIMDELENSDNKMTYEGIFRAKYLGMVLDETLRKYPAAPILMRQAGADYVIPGHDVTIEKGTQVYVCPIGLHHDELYYTNPQVFDPERFSEEEKAKRHHYTYLPFGEGPRFCIGQRFAQMTMRAALFSLLSKYKFEPCDKTPEKIILDPLTFIVSPLGGMSLKITKI